VPADVQPTATAGAPSVLLVLGTSAGGVGRHVAALAGALARAGHRVVVAGPEPTLQAAAIGPGTTTAVLALPDRPHLPSVARDVVRLRALARHSDVVHAHGLRAGALTALAASTLRRRVRPPVVVTLHNALVGGGRSRRTYALLERVVARRAEMVLGVSADLEQRMREVGARRVGHALVPAPAGAPPARDREQVRAELGVPDGVPLVLTVARLAPQKGLPLLLDAMQLLVSDRTQLQCVIAGDGPMRQALQARVEATRLPVRLLGRRDDVPDLLAAADVAVCPSVWEGQPLVVQEALRLGVPLVATDVGGTAQVAGQAAVLVPYGDPAALAAAVRGLLQDPHRRQHLAIAGRGRAAALPTDDDALDQVRRIYRDVLGGPATDGC
jgi:glycosyltransferase involved in cell wall biosynthesis